MHPYYSHAGVTIYHGNAVEVLAEIDLRSFSVMLTDPPYGIAYDSGRPRLDGNARGIAGDSDTKLRDTALEVWGERPALAFGSWRVAKPVATRGVLVWDKGGALGMGDLEMPWKFDHEEIYVIGRGFVGRRDCGSVIRCPPEQSMGRLHPHQKPVRLLRGLLAKCPPGAVLDPFCGSGSTLVAAKDLGRGAVGIEIEERYCEIAAKRLSQEVLPLGAVG